MGNKEMIEAWRQAARDLGLKIQIPLKLTVDGDEINCYLLIEEFGSKKGTVVFSIDEMDDINGPGKAGFYCSALNPLTYGKYDRDHFVETLTDWGYYGDKNNVPSWYKGYVYGD
jgi:hypothetical protein